MQSKLKKFSLIIYYTHVDIQERELFILVYGATICIKL